MRVARTISRQPPFSPTGHRLQLLAVRVLTNALRKRDLWPVQGRKGVLDEILTHMDGLRLDDRWRVHEAWAMADVECSCATLTVSLGRPELAANRAHSMVEWVRGMGAPADVLANALFAKGFVLTHVPDKLPEALDTLKAALDLTTERDHQLVSRLLQHMAASQCE